MYDCSFDHAVCVGLAGDCGVTSVTMSIVLTIAVPITMSMPVTIQYDACYTSGYDDDVNADCGGDDAIAMTISGSGRCWSGWW